MCDVLQYNQNHLMNGLLVVWLCENAFPLICAYSAAIFCVSNFVFFILLYSHYHMMMSRWATLAINSHDGRATNRIPLEYSYFLSFQHSLRFFWLVLQLLYSVDLLWCFYFLGSHFFVHALFSFLFGLFMKKPIKSNTKRIEDIYFLCAFWRT